MPEYPKSYIGTSGWYYPHWSGSFYPTNLAKEGYLEYYSERFQTVEINNSFYQLPEKHTFEEWRQIVPPGFLFSVKASRYITHMKKLKDPQEPVKNILERISILGDKLGPVLFQLPPRWRPNPNRLRAFLKILPKDFRYAFEFRDSRWFDEGVLNLLRENQAAFCIYHLEGNQSPREVTSDFIYIRLHGPKDAYQGRYTNNDLAGWAGAISSWRRQGKQVFCYFNNDVHAAAPANATELKDMIAQ